MKLHRMRLLLRDLAAAAAFGAMAISGELPAALNALVLIGLLLALLQRRVFTDRSAWLSVSVLASCALALYGMVATGRMDLVIASCSFAGLIAVQRMLTTPSPATDGQVLLTSLLMLSGGAALSADLAYGLCLAVYGVLTMLSLGLGTLEAHLAPGEQLPLRPAVRVLLFGAFAALMGAAVFFLVFPRLSWNVASQRVSRGITQPTTGFAGEVRLGGASGTLKTSPQPVARVLLEPDPGKEKLEAYWVGSTLDSFDGLVWGSTSEKPLPPTRHAKLDTLSGQKRGVVQKISLLPSFGSRTVIALDRPLGFRNPVAHSVRGESITAFQIFPGREVRLTGSGNGFSYVAMSEPDVGEAEAQDRAEVERQLPPTLDPRIEALARRVTADASGPREAAERLTAYLQTKYEYTLELDNDSEDPLASFLFETQRGHCEYFATALAVLLRSAGHRSRLVTGFFGGEQVDGQYILRAGDAHSWTEVYVPGEGYLRFDATPPLFRSAQASPLWAAAVGAMERLEGLWRALVVDYTIRDQARLAFGVMEKTRAKRRLPSVPWRPVAIALLAGAFAYGLIRWVGAAMQRVGSQSDAQALRDAIEAALRRSTPPVPPTAEPVALMLEESCARLRQEGHPALPTLEAATQRYLEARFGTNPLRAPELSHWQKRLRREVLAR